MGFLKALFGAKTRSTPVEEEIKGNPIAIQELTDRIMCNAKLLAENTQYPFTEKKLKMFSDNLKMKTSF